jgi:hypothetical protein
VKHEVQGKKVQGAKEMIQEKLRRGTWLLRQGGQECQLGHGKKV